MAIIVDNDTRLVVQGLTGLARAASTASATAPTARTSSPASRPARAARTSRASPSSTPSPRPSPSTGANTAMIFVPAPFAADAIYEAVDAGIATVICITEGVPAHDMLRIHTYVRPRGVTLIGPNCPGALSPGKANVGIIPAEIFTRGQRRPRLALRHADLPDRPRADAAGARQLDDRRDRRRPGRRLVVHRHPRASSRPTPRPSTSSWSARSAATRRRRRPRSSRPS